MVSTGALVDSWCSTEFAPDNNGYVIEHAPRFEILEQRQVLAIPVENRPGTGAALLRRITDAGVSLDLMYTTLDGRLVLGSEDMAGLRAATDV